MTRAYILTVVTPCMECCRGATCNCLHISLNREESIGRKYKGTTMAHWDDHLQNSSFMNRMQYYIIPFLV